MTTWDHLDVALVQAAADIAPGKNRVRLDELAPRDVDLVVFPEAFARDFGSADDDLAPDAETLDGPFATELARVAADRGSTVVAGMFEAADGHPFNTLLTTDGARSRGYRKIHLYDSFGYRESDRLSAGPVEPVLVEVGGATVGLMTCYDLRFPELARALVAAGAEILVVPAAWVAGERKVDHWRTLARARAIENTAYVVAAGQPAPRYCGHSIVVDPLGDVLVEAGPDEEVVTARLERSVIERAREVNPSLANRRM
ncbi:carbon-nitrogen hydrolase family protein [Nocardioides panacihumi]|uniref:Carbon-nitrogen hydrolase family protein n=1 Tax=Nocardioides panacihumi TaxID=400774 RepID=A0ABP5BPU3_9ACTN